MTDRVFIVDGAGQGATLAAFLRRQLPGRSWREVRQLVETRQVRIGDDLCLDSARRLREGNAVTLLAKPAASPRHEESIALRHVDEHVVVAEKPAGINTVRHPAEREWTDQRKALSPTLEDLVWRELNRRGGRGALKLPRLRIVHRIDKETSGLVVFARTVTAERGLGKQFHAHSVHRRYLAVIPGRIAAKTIESALIRDRGDGRRGSTQAKGQGKRAVTHIEVVEQLAGYTLVGCRLETGRTHQIRIHLAEAGHPICGEKVYNRLIDGTTVADNSGAPRLALHAAELGFDHPVTGEHLHFSMPLPGELARFVASLRRDQ